LDQNGNVTSTVVGIVSQCFHNPLSTTSNTVTFTNAISWSPCGSPIALVGTYLAWGTGNTDFCIGDGFQCGGTPSKCHAAQAGEITIIQVPQTGSASATHCSDAAGSYSSTFDLTALQSQIISNSTNYNFTFYNISSVPSSSADTSGKRITNPSAFQATAASTTVYAYVCDKVHPTACNWAAVTLSIKDKPAAPILSKVDNCDGTTAISAKDAGNNLISTSELTWSNGATTNPISVTTTTTVTATRTVNGCTSASSNSITPAPRTTPAAPVLSKTDNCDGTTTISAKDGSNNLITASELTWSNGATTNPITVTTATAVTATRTVNGCASGNSNSITPAPGTTPSAPAVTYNPPACDATTFSVTVTNVVSGVTYTIKNKNGANISGVSPGNSVTAANTNNITFSNIPAGSGYQVTASLGSCSSTAASCGTSSTATIKVMNQTPVLNNDQPTVNAYPNPFNNRVKFAIVSPTSGDGSLEIYNIMGQKVKTIYQGHINAGNQSFELTIPKKQQATLIYVFRVGDKKVTGKLLQLNN
jgi:hypothetical protein